MIRTLLALFLALAAPGIADAAPGGAMRVLLKGYWACEAGGDATSPPRPMPQDSFRVIADSSYVLADGTAGTYLLLGQDVVMTSGPFHARRYALVGQGMLHPIDAQGNRGEERCVHQRNASGNDADSAMGN